MSHGHETPSSHASSSAGGGLDVLKNIVDPKFYMESTAAAVEPMGDALAEVFVKPFEGIIEQSSEDTGGAHHTPHH